MTFKPDVDYFVECRKCGKEMLIEVWREHERRCKDMLKAVK